MSFKHSCIKCKQSYEDKDFDDYYCPTCLVARKAAISELDGKYNTVGQQPNGLLAQYDAARQGRKFPLAKSLFQI